LKSKDAKRIFILVSAGILILSVVFYAIYTYLHAKSSPEVNLSFAGERKSIAILPFKNLSNDISDQYVYDGVMDEIFNSLTKINEIRVISSTSVMQFRNTTLTVPEIGKRLGVDYIVEGSGQKFGRTFRLRVQLIDVYSDTHIWSDTFQRKMKKTKRLFSVQSRIARSIALELNATLTRNEEELIEKVPTRSMSAYNLYLKANSLQNEIKSHHNHDAYESAKKLYSDAISEDAGFARAYTGLAFAYWNMFYYENYFELNYLDSCRILAEQALQYDPVLDEAYFILGEFFAVNGNPDKALENFNNALEINPNYYQAYYLKGYLLSSVLGNYVESLKNYHKALLLIGGSERAELLDALGTTYRNAGFVEKAKYYYSEKYTLDNNKAAYMDNMAFVEFCSENFDEALTLWKQKELIDTTSTSSQNYYFVTPGHIKESYKLALRDIENFKKSGALNLVRSHRAGYAFWQAGRRNEGEYYFTQQIKYSEESIKLNRITAQRKAAQYDLAATYAFLNNKSLAYKYLDDCAERSTFPLVWITLIKHDLLFSGLRDEERFKDIIHKVEVKYLAEHERVGKWITESEH
jgi:TolB-like protein/Flp pilus assembly protein TadD